jgi:hypothetical protein
VSENPTMMPKGLFFEPVRELARIIGKMERIQGDTIRAKPSINPSTIVIRSDFIGIIHHVIIQLIL